MTDPYDVIVVGVGAHGSATIAELAARGCRVLGLERSDVPNTLGSSGGVNRMIRLAYNEDPRYVPLVQHAYDRWRALEARVQDRLLVVTGGLDIGSPSSAVVEGSIAACRAHELRHEILSRTELRRRYPAFEVPDDHVAVLQPDAGFVMSERAIAAYAATAIADGAEIHGNEPVVAWEATDDLVTVRTDRDTYRARRLLLAAGAWMPSLVDVLRDVAVPERQVLMWTQPREPAMFQVGTFPVFIHEDDDGTEWYGFPEFGIPGVKLGRYRHRGETIDPRTDSWRKLDGEDERHLREGLERFLPAANGPLLSWRTCIFTNVPDQHFIIDRLPDRPNVIIASPCSGHGFKFASALGDVLADLVMDREPGFDIGMFRLDRFEVANVA